MFSFIKRIFGLPTEEEIKQAQRAADAPYKVETPEITKVAAVIAGVAVNKGAPTKVKKPRKPRAANAVKEKAPVKTKAAKITVVKPAVKAKSARASKKA